MATLEELMAKLTVSTQYAIVKPKTVEEHMAEIGIDSKGFIPDYSRAQEVSNQVQSLIARNQYLKQKQASTQNTIDKGINDIKYDANKKTWWQNAYSYISNKFGSGVASSLVNINPSVLMDSVMSIPSLIGSGLFNVMSEAVGSETRAEAWTYTKARRELLRAVGVGDIATEGIKDPEIKAIVQDINSGTNIWRGIANRLDSVYQFRTDELAGKVGSVTKLIGDVVQSIPQTAVMALPGGELAYAMASFNDAMSTASQNGTVISKKAEENLYQSLIDVASESIFGLFKNSRSILGSELSKIAKETVKPTTAQVIWSVMKQAGEEGAEELIAFPFSTLVDWRYNNPNKPITDYLTWDTAKKFGYAGLVGFISGGLLSGAAASIDRYALSRSEKEKLKSTIDTVLDNPIENITPEQVDTIASLTAKGVEGDTKRIVTDSSIVTERPTTTELIDEIKNLGAKVNAPVESVDVTKYVEPIKAKTEAPIVSRKVEVNSELLNLYKNSKEYEEKTVAVNQVLKTNKNELENKTVYESDGYISNGFFVVQKNTAPKKLTENISKYKNISTTTNLKRPLDTAIKDTEGGISAIALITQSDEKFSQTLLYDSKNNRFAFVNDKYYSYFKNNGYEFILSDRPEGGILLTKNGNAVGVLMPLMPDKNKLDELSNILSGKPYYKTLESKVVGKTKPTKKESELVKESKIQEDVGRLNFIDKNILNTLNSVEVSDKTLSYKDTQSEEVKKRIEEARAMPKTEKNSFVQMAYNVKKALKEKAFSGAVPVSYKYGDFRRTYIDLINNAQRFSSKTAEEIVKRYYSKINSSQQKLLFDAILYFDMYYDVKSGRFDSGNARSFGISTPQEVLKTVKQIAVELSKPENKNVIGALETRTKLKDEQTDILIEQAEKVGIDLRHLKSNPYHMYHAVIEYQKEYNDIQKTTKQGRKVEYKGRKGSAKDYVADPRIADYLIIKKVKNDIYTLKLFEQVKKLNINNTLKLDENGDWIIPDGYAEIDPSMLGVTEYEAYSKKSILNKVYAELESLDIDPTSDKGKTIIKKAIKQANKATYVVPQEIATSIETMRKAKEGSVGKVARKVMSLWKYSKIRLPSVAPKYNLRNFTGDLDAVITGNAKAIFSLPSAFKELYKFYFKNGVLTEELSDFINRTGLTTGQTVQELRSYIKSDMFDLDITQDTSAKKRKNLIRKAWSMLTLEKFTEFREQLLRYAAYKAYIRELNSRKNGLPKFYAASIPEEIQSIEDVKDRAAKLSNDLVGAYNDVSIYGQYIADHVIPFFRFQEVNIKRYYRMAKNTFYNDSALINDMGTSFAKKAGFYAKAGAFTIYKIGKMLLGITLFYGALQMLNLIWAKDEEEKLPQYVKDKPHIVFPSWLVGTDRLYYIDKLGSLSDLLNMFTIDYSIGKDIDDIVSGRKKLSDRIIELGTMPIYNIFNSSNPLYKIAFEVITGKQYYPDPSSPTNIRDTWEYLFKQVGLEDEYNAIAGKPQAQGNYAYEKRSILFNSVLPGDAAIYDVYEMIENYNKSHDIPGTNYSVTNKNSEKYKRSQAAYYYKLALKLNDNDAAVKYLAEYISLGGTKKTLKQSLASMEPLYGMSNEDKKTFMNWITPEEKKVYNRAVKYFEELIK